MMHLTHANDEGTNEIEVSFLTTAPSQLILRHGIVTGDFGDRREEEMCAVR
jgi:hypothetical protein